MSERKPISADIAVIGMAARFPDAGSISRYWSNLLEGKCSTRRYSHEALRKAGVPQAELAADDYIGVTAQIDEVEYFDPVFFGMNLRDAKIMDPQFRHFFEVAWLALEDAGLAHGRKNHIGVFSAAGMSLYSGKTINNYFRVNIASNPEIMANLDPIQAKILSEREYLPTQLCYRLNLTGPGCAVNTACSSALVAIHQAMQSLLNDECDAALAGASAIHAPHLAGYRYSEGGIFSAQGACLPFDASADGIVGGNGVGVVALKKLARAQRDGDRIHAVIKASAVNNDGAQKVSYTAPSVEGQKRNLRRALRDSGLDVNTIGLIEAHGTGTALGDQIELGALLQVMREMGHCNRQKITVGSVKSNLGHLDTAAGMAAFIKTVCAVREGKKPGTAGFRNPNAALPLGLDSPFEILRETRAWNVQRDQRHAIVCALGAGGTNAHIVLSGYTPPQAEVEQTDASQPFGEDSTAYAVLCISAKSASALSSNRYALADYLADSSHTLDAVGYSLAEQRSFMEHRCVAFGRNRQEMIAALRNEVGALSVSGVRKRRPGKKTPDAFALSAHGRLRDGGQWQALGAALVDGEIEPRALWRQAVLRPVTLPGYCFDRVRCWVDVPQPSVEMLPLYRYRWQPCGTLAGAPITAEWLKVDSLHDQSAAWLQALRDGRTSATLILQESASSTQTIASQLAAIGQFLYQLDEVAPRGLLLLFVSQEAALVDDEPGSSIVRPGAMIWAAIKAAATELLNVAVHWLDVTVGIRDEQIAQVAALLPATKGTERALRGNTLYQLEMLHLDEAAQGETLEFKEQDAVVLIGGRGGIGQRLLAHYMERNARQLFVVSRQKPTVVMRQQIVELAAQSVSLHWIEGDASSQTVWASLIERLTGAGCRVKVLCHLAGVLADAPLSALTERDIERVLQPKLGVCQQIALHFERLQPEQLILFSSLSAGLGSPSQFAYAAANAALDSWAENLYRCGVNVHCVQWGPWAGEGMAQQGREGAVNHNSSRLKPIEPAEGLAALERLMRLAEPLALAAWLPPMERLRDMTRIELGEAIFTSDRHAVLLKEGAVQSLALDKRTLIMAIVREMAGISTDDQSFVHMTFSTLGLDSLAITHLRKRLADEAQINLSISELYSYPSVTLLCDYLQQKAGPKTAPPIPVVCRNEDLRRKLVNEICQFFPEAGKC